MRIPDRVGRSVIATVPTLFILTGAAVLATGVRAQVADEPGAASVPAASPASSTATTRASREGSPTEELARARNLFAYGDYTAAADMLAELVLPGRLTAEEDLVEAHRMLGISYALTERRAEARRAFMALLYLAPDTRLDPFLTPPAVVEFFDAVAAEIGDKLDEVRAKRAQDRAREATIPTVTVVERTVRQRPWFTALVPLGYPQFERGDWGWGLWFLGAQGLGLLAVATTSVASLALVTSGELPAQDKPVYDALRVGNWLSAGALLAAYAGGVLESVLSYQPETLERERVREVPRDRVPALSVPAAKE
ncbi:MAG: hypothetical protein ABIJ09_12800 [Pseudomonadota bacterium]